ncbi:MAG: hypothetical protein OXC38_03620 [Gammaproteobacteria bacterium]|nr:hypothetical protein [Gammaproteobacteria bacterium]
MDPNTQKSAPASGAGKQSAPRPPKFDTMRAVGNLKEAEFREQQAVAIVETIRDAQVELATRDDLYAVRDELRGEISSLRSEMRADMQAQLAAMQWRLLIGVSIIVGVFGTIVTLAGGR